jgi:hypothetical protein
LLIKIFAPYLVGLLIRFPKIYNTCVLLKNPQNYTGLNDRQYINYVQFEVLDQLIS